MRLDVRKTYKLFIGGKFPRSESGRTYRALDHKGEFLANIAQGSRKDARDAVVAARSAQSGWDSATAYNRGQVLYRIAEMLEGRRDQFVSELQALTGISEKKANLEVDAAIDSWVWHAGWSDKIDSVAGNMNPVAGPFFNISTNQPTGVVAVIAPQDSGLVGLVNSIAPAIVSGNTVVVIASEKLALPAITFTEVLATSDLPGGVVNVLTGSEKEIAPWLASHQDVNAIDTEGSQNAVELELKAAENLKRVIRPGSYSRNGSQGSLQHILDLMEVKTVWHPKGH
ncbi:MAG: aldehyde dehydrogenase family protein [Aquiluna sp.]|nr:aldehyde dehydrogenase family protein [Aquiluna sp.]MCF8545803.1 aldehyde dehydrogenase family protein [Aquiluna sp.]